MDRRERMAAALGRVFGAAARGGAPAGPRPSDEHLGFLTEIVFGELWARPGLEIQQRELLTLATLVALNRTDELRSHLLGALNVGFSKEQILEAILHVGFYAGAPVAHSAFLVANEVFTERGEPPEPAS